VHLVLHLELSCMDFVLNKWNFEMFRSQFQIPAKRTSSNWNCCM